MPPGANAGSDDSWSQTYGASMDAYLSLLDGGTMFDNIAESFGNFDAPYRDGLPLATNSNLYEPIDDRQQIQFMAGGDSVAQARAPSGPLVPNEIRSIGLRAPTQMVGWGKTVAMRPTDPDPGDVRVNDDEHKMDRSTWKVGPLDARWDERRKTWRAFNDLIADEYAQSLGTPVFSTNPDSACGFPFMRGFIQDVWAVRKTWREQSTTGLDSDLTQSAHVCTKLNGLAIGNTSEGELVGKWSEVLTITNTCSATSKFGKCGSEVTIDGTMAILANALFYNGTQAGPISFTASPPADDVLLGSMYFVGVGNCGEWVPGVTPDDICTAAGAQFSFTFDNDKALQIAIETLCKSGVKYNRTHRKELAQFVQRDIAEDLQDVRITSDGFVKIEDWTATIIASINAAVQGAVVQGVNSLATSTQAALDLVVATLIALMNAGFAQMAANLLENCGCTISAYVAEAPSIVLTPVSFLRTNVMPPIDLQPEIVDLAAVDTRLEILGNNVGDYIGTFDLPIIFPLGTIKDPCNPTTTVTKNCTI
ncbi:MAG: hypothetical protein KUG81_10145 [Gammaproteobacteria bacterium]|nr:hypothetical protein [Gammaproteobacteria bacterium]